MKISKTIPSLLIISVLIPVIAVAVFFFGKSNFRILETSLLSILRNIAEQNAPEPPEFGIDSIVARKVSDPTENFKYYKYKATIILHNYGGNLIDGRVILHAGEDQKHDLIRNTDEGFTLMRDQTYIVRNFEFIFDGKYNGGEMPISVEVVDESDYYEENNSYVVDIFESNAKIESISVEEILNDGTVVLDFDSVPFSLRKHDFELLISNEASYKEEDVRYDEVYTRDEVYGYYRVKNSLKNVQSGFDSRSVTELESHFVELPNDPFLDEENYFVYVKAVNPNTGNYATSNLIMLPSQEAINRAEFAELFVQGADVDPYDAGVVYFEDLEEDQWYSSSIQTLFNLGLFDIDFTEYNPEEDISRAEVLRIVLDYFDVDLVIGVEAPHFEDVGEDDEIYSYVEALLADSKGGIFDEYFNPDKPATRNYLNYLINEYSESN